MKISSTMAYGLFHNYVHRKLLTSHNHKQDVLVSFSTASLTISNTNNGWTVRLRPKPLNPLALIQLEDLIIRKYK